MRTRMALAWLRNTNTFATVPGSMKNRASHTKLLPGEFDCKIAVARSTLPYGTAVRLKCGEMIQLLASDPVKKPNESRIEKECRQIKVLKAHDVAPNYLGPTLGSLGSESELVGAPLANNGDLLDLRSEADSCASEQNGPLATTNSETLNTPPASTPATGSSAASASPPALSKDSQTKPASHGSETSAKSSVGSSDLWLDSPHPRASFSPKALLGLETRLQIDFILAELIQSEYAFVKSLVLLSNYYIEPLLLRCSVLRLTCSPLINMAKHIGQLKASHEQFLTEVCQERTLDAHASGITALLQRSPYGEYSAHAELLLVLVAHQVAPFDLCFVGKLQGFLERTQPDELRMDLSFVLLLQKPVGRIAKYPLFLSALAKLCPGSDAVAGAGTSVAELLTEINQQICSNETRQHSLEQLNSCHDFSMTGCLRAEFFGLINHQSQCEVHWMACGRHGLLGIVRRMCQVMVHDFHVTIVDSKNRSVLYMLPFRCTQFISEGNNCEGGLYSARATAAKLVFATNHCHYELLIVGQTPAVHVKFVEACVNIPRQAPEFRAGCDADCYVGPDLARFDINIAVAGVFEANKAYCYFRQTSRISSRPGLRLRPSPRFARLGYLW